MVNCPALNVMELCPAGNVCTAISQIIVRTACVMEHDDKIAPPDAAFKRPTGVDGPLKKNCGIEIVIVPSIFNSVIVENVNITGLELETCARASFVLI